MQKIVINVSHGGFGLSKEAQEAYAEKKDIGLGRFVKSYESYEGFSTYDVARDDPDLVSVVESMGAKADGRFAKLRVVEIPDEVNWSIHEYDGSEWVAEVHRTWS